MDGAASGHRRRRSTLLDGFMGPDESTMAAGDHRDLIEEEPTQGDAHEDRRSETSSGSMSEDFEMDELPDDEDPEEDEESGLTGKDRKKRRRQKQRSTRLDARIASLAKGTSLARDLADREVLKKSVVNVFLIFSWYLFSLSISLYNKWMFSKDHLNFRFPLFTTSVHMLVQFTLASLVLLFFPRLRPHAADDTQQLEIPQHNRTKSSEKPLMSKTFYATRIAPCGLATGLDIGLGNTSLRYISLTFFTMCKSSALGFVLFFAFLFRLETPSIKLVLIILFMTVGVVMMVAGEAAFNAIGFVLIISSAAFSGFRWALTQILLLRNPATSNPFSSIFFLAPIMFFSLLIIALPVERPDALMEGLQILFEAKGPLMGTLLILFPGTIAFAMTSSEFALLQRTSVVTLSICGIFKEVVTISAAGIVFHDPLTPINVSGLLITIASIAAYNYIKIRKMRRDARNEEEEGGHGGGQGEGGVDGYAPVMGAPPDAFHDPMRSSRPSSPLPKTNKSPNAFKHHRTLSVNASGTNMGFRTVPDIPSSSSSPSSPSSAVAPYPLPLSAPATALPSPLSAVESSMMTPPARSPSVKKDAREED